MSVFFALAAVILVATPAISLFRTRLGETKTRRTLYAAMSGFFVCVLGAAVAAMTQDASAADAAQAAAGAAAQAGGIAQGLGYIGAGMTTLGSCIGSGIAVAGAASAALGAISENEKIFGKALIMVALAESIALYGMLISILILNKI